MAVMTALVFSLVAPARYRIENRPFGKYE